ncbi:MAG: hypothetical protein ACLQU3_11480 [Limisphaerales bacterium]
MMSRRTLLKLVALLPWAGPAIAKALANSQYRPGPVHAPYLPAAFPKWNRVIDGLSDAGKWALDIERSRLPDDIAVPRAGQVWATVRDCQVSFRVSISHQVSAADSARFLQDFARLFGVARLRRGERVRILGVDDPNKPLRVTFQPVRCQDLQESIVPEDVRRSRGYVGHELSLKTAKTLPDLGKEPFQTYFNEAFRLVEDAE